MQRVSTIRAAGQWDERACADQVVLDADERHRRRATMTATSGGAFLLDLPHAATLHDGDALELDDGTLVRVVSRAELLVEIAAASAHDLARLAWHLGNRHTEVQVVGEGLRIRRDHVLEAMLARLGATLTMIDAPFEPERGAYDHHGHQRHHEHGHDQHG
jgi:urease accessory protein